MITANNYKITVLREYAAGQSIPKQLREMEVGGALLFPLCSNIESNVRISASTLKRYMGRVFRVTRNREENTLMAIRIA